MQYEIFGQNGPKDIVSFSFKVIFQIIHHDHNDCCRLPMGPNRTNYFEAPLSVVHLVYNREIHLACRVKHLEPFSLNGLFVHLLDVRQVF